MVSLSRSINTNSGGATFFSDSLTMDDRELQPMLQTYGTFRPLNTIHLFSFHILYTLMLEVIAIIYAVIHPDETHKCREYFLIVYLHIGLWFLTLIIDQITRMKHYSLRLNGYLDFYKDTQVHHRLPLYIVSLWSVAIMLIQTIMQHFYSDDFAQKCLQGGAMSPIGYLCAFITVEFCVIVGVNMNYIVRVYKFNKQKSPPDVQKSDWTSVGCAEVPQEEIGYRHLGDKLYDFIEKQADLIRHLKDQNAHLNEKIVILNAKLKDKHQSQTTSSSHQE